MRFILATAGAGLLVLVGSAVAGRPAAHTLRKSAGGPIEAIAENNGVAAWFTSGSKTKTCDVVHVLSPGKRDRALPQPSFGTKTCGWDLTDGESQLAIASRMSTALWTLHESGPQPVDFVLAASFGGSERQVGSLHRASAGIGQWLGGVAGAGRTLAYSWDDVEYVDPSGCLSGGSCRQKIADGGIRLVTRTDVVPLPGADPALQLAASGGRIAYVPATVVKAGRPSATTKGSLTIVDATTGNVVGQPSVHGIPLAIALSSHVLAVLATSAGSHDRISWFSATDGSKLGDALVSEGSAPQLAVSDRLIVYRLGRDLHGISTHTRHNDKLVRTGPSYLGLSLAHGRLIWAENHNHTGRLRALAAG